MGSIGNVWLGIIQLNPDLKIVHLVLKISTCLCFIKVYIVKFALVCIVFLALFGDLALNVLYSNVSFFAVLMASKFDPGSH